MLEGFGPLTSPAARAPSSLRAAILGESKFREDMLKPAKIYPSLAAAVQARVGVCAMYPGKQYISHQAAEWIVGRGSRVANAADTKDQYKIHPDTEDNYAADDLLPDLELPPGSAAAGEAGAGPPVRFRYDPRLVLPSHTYLTDDQVEAFFDAIACPTLFVQAEDGWPARDVTVIERRMAILRQGYHCMLQIRRHSDHSAFFCGPDNCLMKRPTDQPVGKL